jgi:HEAT repeat protein
VLLEMLADPHHELAAAAALVWLGDTTAAPVLMRALAHPSLCVDAAVALRKLGGEVDPDPLAALLQSGDETGKIAAAEALTVLFDATVPFELRAREVKP